MSLQDSGIFSWIDWRSFKFRDVSHEELPCRADRPDHLWEKCRGNTVRAVAIRTFDVNHGPERPSNCPHLGMVHMEDTFRLFGVRCRWGICAHMVEPVQITDSLTK